MAVNEAQRLHELQQEQKKASTPKLTDEERLEAERMAEVESQAKTARLANEDRLVQNIADEMDSRQNIGQEATESAQSTTDMPVSLGGKPKKGSIGEVLVNFDPIEQVVTGISGVGTQLKEGAAEAKLQGDNLTAGVKASAYMATQIGIGLIEGATFIVRPHKIASAAAFAVQGVAKVVTSPDPIGVIATGAVAMGAVIAKDPVMFVGRTTGSVLGGMAAGKAINRILGPKTVKYEPPTDTDPTDFLVSEDIYPHQIVTSPESMTLIPESTVILDDLGGGFLDTHLVPRGGWPKSRITGYRQTGGELIQEVIPEGMGTPTTIYHPMSVPYPIFEHTQGLNLNPGAIVLPRGLKLPIALGTITGIASIEHPTVETPNLAIEQETQELIDAGLKMEVSIASIRKSTGIRDIITKEGTLPGYTIKPDSRTLIIPSPYPPQYTPKPIQDVDPDVITLVKPKQVTDIIQTPKPIQETPVKPYAPTTPFFPSYHSTPSRKVNQFYLPRQPKRRRVRIGRKDLVGFELKTTKLPSPKDMLGNTTFRIPRNTIKPMKQENILGKKKKFKWPKL